MVGDKTQWKRCGFVKIIPENGDVWASNANGAELDFSFDISKPIAAVCMEAKISIFGMNWKNMKAFSTWTAEALALGLNTKIEVWAGYGDKPNLIFSGTIFHAMPTQPPDRVLNIKARSGFFRFNKVVNGDQADNSGVPKMEDLLTVDEWFNQTANILGGVVNTSNYVSTNKNEKLISPASFDSSATHDTVFKEMYWQARNLNPSAYLIEEDADKNGKYQFRLINELEKSMNMPCIHLSPANGLIGIPTINYADIEVTTLLNMSIARGGFISINSEYGELSRGMKYRRDDQIVESDSYETYRVYEVRYHGQLRGEAWYTTCKAWRFWKEGMVRPDAV